MLRLRPTSAPAPWLLLLLALFAAPAWAQLVLRGATLTLNPDQATPAGSITASGSGLARGTYRVELLVGRTSHLLLELPGDGSFQRQVRIPSIAPGTYTVALLVDGSTVDTAAVSVVPPLSVGLPATARAGSTVAFSVSGLAAGSLSLEYAGVTVFGPVAVSSGSHAGKLRLPLDRPATLPDTVTVFARNTVGRTVPRVGARGLDVQPADTSPFIRLLGGSSSTDAPATRQRFQITGSLATNEAQAADVQVQYFWKAGDGSVMPMGASQGTVLADGSFDYSMRLPQAGTLSAGTAQGSGQVIAVSQWRDGNGVVQQKSAVVDSLTAPIVDTDAAIDLTLVLSGNDGSRIERARIDLVNAALDDLYDSNTGGVSLDGAPRAGLETQFNQATDEVLGCPANLERQYTDANGIAQFEFDLAVPAGGYNVDGSGPAPQITIAPSEDCVPSADVNTPGWCQEVDPAGVKFTAVVRVAHTGYGYTEEVELPDGSRRLRELPVMLHARVDRYTGEFELETCIPGQECTRQDFDRSAYRPLVLPRLPQSGLLLADPSFKASTGHRLEYAAGHQAGTNPVRYRPVTDLTPLEGKAAFQPASPPGWTVEVSYDPGAGAPLQSVHLFAAGHVVELQRLSGGADCNAASSGETWGAALPAALAEAFRFPGRVFGNGSKQFWVYGVDVDGKVGVRELRLSFQALEAEQRELQDTPGLVVHMVTPHVHRMELAPAIQAGATQSDAVVEYEVGKTENRVDGNASYALCTPGGSDCNAISMVGFAHRQFDRVPSSQPAPVIQAGNGSAGQGDHAWKVLFDKTIPLFRWYWGVPELISAEVFADLGIKAEYLLDVLLDPLDPTAARTEAGGRLGVLLMIGVDIDVLFGILVDAGASISGLFTSSIVTTTSLSGTQVDPCLSFTMDFNGWLEIGCPVPNPFDPTCYIPDLEDSFNILHEVTGSGCSAGKAGPATGLGGLLARLPLQAPAASDDKLPPVLDLYRRVRGQLWRRPAIAVDDDGTRLVLALARQDDGTVALVARTGGVRGFGDPQVLSTGFGIRDTAVSFFDGGALAVWAESDLPARLDPELPDAADAVRHQHLRYAVWNGESWSQAGDVTQAGFGEGQVRLARCRSPLLRGGCTGHLVTLAFQRNLDGVIAGRKGIFTADFNGSSWGPVQRVDQSGDYNITPALAYQQGVPVIAWVRYAPGSGLDALESRQLALRRFDGRSAEEIPPGLPRRVAQPSLVANGATLAIAFTRAAPGDAFIGTRQALHLAQSGCSGCSFSSWQVEDQHGRALYVERPTLLMGGQGEAVVTFRGLAYGALPGAADPEDNLLPGDALGMKTVSGELLQVRSPLSPSPVHVLALSNDGAMHAQPAAALDPSTGEIIAVSVRAELVAGMAKAARPDHAGKAMARAKALDEDLVLSSIADLPDLAVVALSSSADRLQPGATLPVTLTLANQGSGWLPDESQQAWVRLFWDTPATRATLLAEFAVPAMAAGTTLERSIEVEVPAAFGVDERQSLRAEILLEGAAELDGSNNAAVLAIGGMPVPGGLLAVSTPGTRMVNLAWTAPDDPRIAGFRVYMEYEGVPRPLGSSFNRGFADLTALYGRTRSYRVSSYSARGVESELSAPISAEPAPPLTDANLFSDSFESPSTAAASRQ